jgi:hypothetical protein
MTIYAMHAPHSQLNPNGLVWSSPGDLTRQVLLNEAGAAVLQFKHTIGHASVRLDCAATTSRPAGHFAGGMTNANPNDFGVLVLNDGVGLGVMFEKVDGRLQTEDEQKADIDDGIQTGSANFIRYGIDPNVCQSLLAFTDEYKKLGLDKTYGLPWRPLYKEGGGCSAFVMAYLELANLITPEIRNAWAFAVRVPMYTQPLIGSPEPLIGGTRNPGVSVPVSRVMSLTRDWATPQEDGLDIAGWDPTQMSLWIDAAIEKALATGSDKVEINGKLRGLLLDRTNVQAAPALTNGTYWSN